MSDEIKPRIDGDGVGRCSWNCPRGITSNNPLASITCCVPEGGVDMTEGDLCPVHARRMAQWAEKARNLISEAAQVDIPIESTNFYRAAVLIRTYPGKDGGE